MKFCVIECDLDDRGTYAIWGTFKKKKAACKFAKKKNKKANNRTYYVVRNLHKARGSK